MVKSILFDRSKRLHCAVRCRRAVDEVSAHTLLIGTACDGEVRRVERLRVSRVVVLREVNVDFTECQIAVMLRRTVNQFTQFLEANLIRSESEHEQHGVDHVALATSVGSDRRCEGRIEWTDDVSERVRLKVGQCESANDQSPVRTALRHWLAAADGAIVARSSSRLKCSRCVGSSTTAAAASSSPLGGGNGGAVSCLRFDIAATTDVVM